MLRFRLLFDLRLVPQDKLRQRRTALLDLVCPPGEAGGAPQERDGDGVRGWGDDDGNDDGGEAWQAAAGAEAESDGGAGGGRGRGWMDDESDSGDDGEAAAAQRQRAAAVAAPPAALVERGRPAEGGEDDEGDEYELLLRQGMGDERRQQVRVPRLGPLSSQHNHPTKHPFFGI